MKNSLFVLMSLGWTLAAGCMCANIPGSPTPKKPQLIKDDLASGSGPSAQPGKAISVHYRGWILDPDKDQRKGPLFGNSYQSGEPLKFVLGAGQVIQGWEMGLEGMKVGGRRRIVVPSELAYGEKGVGNIIPPKAKLLFEVELLAVRQ